PCMIPRDCSGNRACCSGACVDTSMDVNNCGGCMRPCMLAHATAACQLSACAIARCDTGFTNANGLVSDGCEATCNATAADDPDLAFVDENCDGIDGDVSRAIFVATDGMDTAAGTKEAPVAT